MTDPSSKSKIDRFSINLGSPRKKNNRKNHQKQIFQKMNLCRKRDLTPTSPNRVVQCERAITNTPFVAPVASRIIQRMGTLSAALELLAAIAYKNKKDRCRSVIV